MLKIGGTKPAPVEDPLPLALEGSDGADSSSEDSMAEPSVELGPSIVLPKALVLYMGGDMGPFKCSNCCYFSEPGSCKVVEGEIDPEGCCNTYCPPEAAHGAAPDEEEPAEEDAAETPEDELTEEDTQKEG